MFALFEAVIADATLNAGATYGITNITTLHPSAAAHQLFGNLASQTLSTVPEPDSVALVLIALAALLAVSRRSDRGRRA